MTKFKRFENRVWLSSPTMHGDEQKYVQEAFDSNWIAPQGKNVNEFEKEMASYVGCADAVAMSSGTAALHLAVKLANVKQGSIVFCSDLTFAATVNPVCYENGTQVFIDSEWETWNLDPAALERAFQIYNGTDKEHPKPAAVIVANLYGTPAKLDEIQAICHKHQVPLIEDAAESLGASYRGEQTGTFGRWNGISFNGNKVITSSGGGMLLSDDAEAMNKARFWSTQARESFPWYQHEEIGYNYRMSNIVAGIGRGQLLHLEEHVRKKKRIYEMYREGLSCLPVTMNPYLQCSRPNFWLSCLLIEEQDKNGNPVTVTPDDIRAELEQYNIEARHIWKPMHLQPVYRNNDFISVNGQDVGKQVFERGLCLPSDIKMEEDVQEIVIEMIKSVFDQKASRGSR